MKYARKPAFLLTALSMMAMIALLATPLAFADDDHGHGDGQSNVQVQQVGAQGDEDENNDSDDRGTATNAGDHRVQRLVNIINNDVSTLTNLQTSSDEDEDAASSNLSFNVVRTIGVATLETGLTSTQATTLTNAVNANSSALQTFLNGGSAQATAINAALKAANISPSNALAIFPTEDHGLTVITA